MPGDSRRKPLTGTPLAKVFSSNLLGKMIDVAHGDEMDRRGNVAQHFKQAGIVKVRNDTGTDLDRFNIIGLGDPLVLPADSIDEFKRRPTFSGETPTAAHAGRFGVLLEPLAQNAIGEAVVAGVVQAQVDITDDMHDFCEVTTSSEVLTSYARGSAQILASEGLIGQQWCLVRVGNKPSYVYRYICARAPTGLYVQYEFREYPDGSLGEMRATTVCCECDEAGGGGAGEGCDEMIVGDVICLELNDEGTECEGSVDGQEITLVTQFPYAGWVAHNVTIHGQLYSTINVWYSTSNTGDICPDLHLHLIYEGEVANDPHGILGLASTPHLLVGTNPCSITGTIAAGICGDITSGGGGGDTVTFTFATVGQGASDPCQDCTSIVGAYTLNRIATSPPAFYDSTTGRYLCGSEVSAHLWWDTDAEAWFLEFIGGLAGPLYGANVFDETWDGTAMGMSLVPDSSDACTTWPLLITVTGSW